MSKTLFRVISISPQSVLLANPQSITHTFRQKIGRTDKTVDGVRLVNNRVEFIENFKVPVTQNDVTVLDTDSLRLTMSGATLSANQIVERWTYFKANVDAAIADGALQGFPISDTVELVVQDTEAEA